MAHQQAYFLCATPRSGTTLLCDLLAGVGRAGRPQSYYRRQDVGRWAAAWGLAADAFSDPGEFERAYLAAVLREGAGETGVFGLRVMWGTVGDMVARLGALHPPATTADLFEQVFGPLVYVHVSRSDKVAQAISLMRAEQSGLWHLAADGSERQRTGPPAAIRYDASRIAELVTELERDDAAWDRFFAEHGISPVRVTYEALADCSRTEVRKILSSLGLPLGLADGATVQTSKMADDLSAAWAERFRRQQGEG